MNRLPDDLPAHLHVHQHVEMNTGSNLSAYTIPSEVFAVRLRDKGREHTLTCKRGDALIELDVYHGALEPLVVAEVEFESAGRSRVFELPDWFGDEVTK